MIRDLPVYGNLILAPLSGYNDWPFRRLCREFGAALVYTGLLSAQGILYGSQRTHEMLAFHADERPLVCQLFGGEVDTLLAAAQVVVAAGADVLDVNLGCPEPKVTKKGYGAALLKDPAQIGRIFARLTRAVPLPVTAKIRLGWDAASRNYLEVARALEENGAALIAVHGRTADQFYLGEADWDAIAEVKQAVAVPVLASGDVRCVADIARIQAHTGCDGVMIGRAAVGNPWIFGLRDRDAVPLAERVSVMLRHLRDMVDEAGAYHGLVCFRKHLSEYLRRAGLPRHLRAKMTNCDDLDRLIALLEQTALSVSSIKPVGDL